MRPFFLTFQYEPFLRICKAPALCHSPSSCHSEERSDEESLFSLPQICTTICKFREFLSQFPSGGFRNYSGENTFHSEGDCPYLRNHAFWIRRVGTVPKQDLAAACRAVIIHVSPWFVPFFIPSDSEKSLFPFETFVQFVSFVFQDNASQSVVRAPIFPQEKIVINLN